MKPTHFIIILLIPFLATAYGDNQPGRSPAASKAIQLDDSVIENVQHRNLDYLNLGGLRGPDGKIRHLYKKRADFDDKSLQGLRDLGVSP